MNPFIHGFTTNKKGLLKKRLQKLIVSHKNCTNNSPMQHYLKILHLSAIITPTFIPNLLISLWELHQCIVRRVTRLQK